jgi:lysophospholipase L1-like esterase
MPNMPHAKRSTPLLKKSGRKRLLSGLSLTLLSLCLTLLALEGLVRLLPPPYEPTTGPIFSCDNRLGWVGKANLQETLATDSFSQELTFNGLGMHDTDHALEKPPGTFRILMLGDSFVQAIQVAETATAHQVLENILAESGPVEVISGGVVNWGTNQQLLYYRKQGRQFQPDVVLLMFYIGNDFLDNLPGNGLTIGGVNCYAPYFALCADQLQPTPLAYAPGLNHTQDCAALRRLVSDGLGRLYQHSRLYQHIEPFLLAQQPRPSFGQNYPSAFSALYLPSDEATLERAWTITLATIAQLQQEVTADGSRLAVAIISPEIAVRLATLSPAEREIFLRDNPTFAAAAVDLPNQRLAEFLTAQNISFIDLTGPLVEHLAADQTPLYLLGDGHWTVAGNRVAAEALAGWLRETYPELGLRQE